MKNWPALLVAPTLALTNLSITYSLVTPSCSRQHMLAPNLVSALLLLACAWMSWGAWRNWTEAGALRGQASDAAPQRRPFVALVAFMVGSLSCLVVIAQWFPQWVLSPCAN
jgi:TRAP-type C4-dicarboxylate transport system permease small subunit